ncbi:nudix hydrolase 26, chloroplastic isoform X3 [Populus trichocarpa]|uniref:nudix hydrolase 26, chloroplastic isoform X3 n=1 Tax=Populus trichocarpa TaxID=3694 RepID=UPI000D187E7E|nr:nudix hydrolase 26, chloroplastic isoform X3 [Populus trichocarpa]|eukprot:XP_006381951.2 nudix hydrolase 26, chloroplastic isoform X3 [Populus trichocarpa]
MESCHSIVRSYYIYRFVTPNCPINLNKFASVPLSGSSCAALSLTRSRRRSRRRELPPSMETPPDGYRRNVGICLVNSSKKGGAGEGEDLLTAAMRELREETGVTSAEFVAEAPYWLTYDFPPQTRERLSRRWGTNYKGQTQKWFLFKFTGKEDEINLLGDGSETPEFKDWAWLLPERVLELAVDFKKPVYEQVMKVFGPYLQADADEDSAAQNETEAEVCKITHCGFTARLFLRTNNCISR